MYPKQKIPVQAIQFGSHVHRTNAASPNVENYWCAYGSQIPMDNLSQGPDVL